MTKVHLFISSRPMRSGETVIAKCHDVVRKAQILHMWDNMPVNEKLEWPAAMGACRACFGGKPKKSKGRMFCYAISGAVTESRYQKAMEKSS